MWKIEKRYVIYEVCDGLLKNPKDAWGDNMFNQYGYDSEEEAVNEITSKINFHVNFMIVPVTSVYYEVA